MRCSDLTNLPIGSYIESVLAAARAAGVAKLVDAQDLKS